MAKSAPNAFFDAALDTYIRQGVVLVTVCNAEPTTYAEATATFKLADVVVDSSDFTVSDGDTNGRKVRLSAQNAVPIDTTGTATHIALCGAADLRYVTTCTSQALTSGGTVDIPVFDIEIADPT